MDGITAQLTGTVIATPEVRRTRGGMAWMRISVCADAERDAETGGSLVRVSMQGPTVPALAPQLAAGVRIFCRGRLTLRSWKTDSGERKAGLNLAARKVEIIRARVSPRDDSGRRPSVAAVKV